MTDYCTGCMFQGRKRVPFEGPKTSKLAIVGEAPGYVEVIENRPFCGPSGKLLTFILKHIGLDRNQVRIGNVLLCGPITEQERDEYSFNEALSRCRARREEEGDLGEAQVIVGAGGSSVWGLTGKQFTFGRRYPRRGALHYAPDGRTIIPTWHPAAILRSGGADSQAGLSDAEVETMAYDVDKAYRLAYGKMVPFDPEITVTGDPEVFASFAESIPPGVVAIDVESTSVNPLDCKLTVIGLAYLRPDGNACACSLWWPNANEHAYEAMRKMLQRTDLVKTEHNCQYDITVLERLVGPVALPVDDTLICQHTAFPDCRLDLGSVAQTHLALPPWKSIYHDYENSLRGEAKERWTPERVMKLLRYNAMDCATTAALRPVLRKICADRGVTAVADLDVELAECARNMTKWGVPINVKTRETMRTDFEEKSARFEAEVERLVIEAAIANIENGLRLKETEELLLAVQKRANKTKIKVTYGWNLNSPDLMRAAFDAAGVELPAGSLTPTGKRSVGKKAIAQAAEHPLVSSLIEYRRNSRTLSVYFDSEDFILDDDNRLHTAWKVHGTPTGRWSSGTGTDHGMGDIGIALQNWPKPMRRLIEAPDGWLLAGGDYAALELRCIALLAGEEWMINLFNDPPGTHDLHSMNAERLYGKTWDGCNPTLYADPMDQDRAKKKRKLLRQLAKLGIYASLYGAASTTVQEQLRAYSLREPDPVFARTLREISQEECQKFVDAVPRLMPRIARWREESARRITREGKMVCPLSGRVRRWPLGQVDATQTANGPVQMLAGSIMNRQFLTLWHKLPMPPVKVIAQIHDSVALETPEGMAEDMKQLLMDTLTTTVTLGNYTCRFDVEAVVAKTLDLI